MGAVFWLYGNGNWDDPRKTFGDTSVLRAGPRFAFKSIGTKGFLNYFDIAPFTRPISMESSRQAERPRVGARSTITIFLAALTSWLPGQF